MSRSIVAITGIVGAPIKVGIVIVSTLRAALQSSTTGLRSVTGHAQDHPIEWAFMIRADRLVARFATLLGIPIALVSEQEPGRLVAHPLGPVRAHVFESSLGDDIDAPSRAIRT